MGTIALQGRAAAPSLARRFARALPAPDDRPNKGELEKLYLLTREGFCKSALAEYTDRKEATSRYMLAALILGSDAVKTALRREIRRVSDLLAEPEVIERMLREEVLKRDAIEGPEADAAARRVSRRADRSITAPAKPTKAAAAGAMEFHPPGEAAGAPGGGVGRA